MYPTLLSASFFLPSHLLDYTNKGNKASMTWAKLSVFTGDGVLELANYEGRLELKQSNYEDAVSAHPVLLVTPDFFLPEEMLKIRFHYLNRVNKYVLVYEGAAQVHLREGSDQAEEWLDVEDDVEDDVVAYIDLTKDSEDSSCGDLALSLEDLEMLTEEYENLPSEDLLLHSDADIDANIDAVESEVVIGQGGGSPPEDNYDLQTYDLQTYDVQNNDVQNYEVQNHDVQKDDVQTYGVQYADLINSCMDKKRKNCIVCARKFARSLELARHQIGHAVELSRECGRGNTEGEIQYPCGICDEMLGTIDKLKFHLRNHANLTQYQCELCPKTFSDCSNYSKHKKTHLGARVRHCDQCKRTFQTEATLKRHMEKHVNTKPIECEVCFQIFPFKADWKRHTRLSHGDKKVKHHCKICHAKFERMQEKWDHEWEQHKMRKSINDCDRCPFQSRKSSELRLHYRLQHGVLNYRR